MGAFLVNAEPTTVDTNSPDTVDNNPPDTVDTNPSGPNVHIEFPNPFGQNTNLFDVLKSIVNNVLLPIGGVLAVLAFIYSGFLYVIAQGNESKIDEAHRALLYTSVGTALLLGAWVIAGVISNTVDKFK